MEEVCVIDLDHRGRGIAKINDKIVFIPNALPQEIVKIEITKDKRNFSEGKIVQFIKKSPDRIEGLCPYYPSCGGCHLLHLPYSKQLEYKNRKIKNILKRYHLEDITLNQIVPSPNPFSYRNKATFQNKNGKLGYFEEESHHIIPIEKCLLLDDKINEKIKNLPKKKEKVVVRSNHNTITFEENKKVIHTIVDFQFLVSLSSFFQINDLVTPLLYQKVKDYLNPQKEDIILDLYCGTGTIGIFVSKEAKKVIGIEKNKVAIQDAKENAKLNHMKNIEFICGDAGIETEKLNLQPTSVIIDPPRSGLNKQTIDTILKLKPNRIVYVSCDPMTLVRDLNILKSDFDISEITPFDMFPNTYHVECVSLLTLKHS